MNKLVKGQTLQEREQGLSSVLAPQTAGLVESVSVAESGATKGATFWEFLQV